jgi:RNA polymerase sigma-70 factor (ECF subfamily)
MRNRPDQAILERAKLFDAQALEVIFDLYSPGIYRYAFRLLGDADIARECMSETFSRFLNALKRGSGPDNYLQAYLYRVAHNWVSDYYRSKVPPSLPLRIELKADPADEPHQAVADHLNAEQLRSALFLLTPDQRQVIILRYLEDLEIESIARALNKPIGAVKALQHRALQALRRIMSNNEDIKL